jgi:hypothetical protein
MAEVPDTDVRPAPSVWSAGDVHHTHDELAAEGGSQGPALDPRDIELEALRAKVASHEAEAAAKPADLGMGEPVIGEPFATEAAVPGV